MTLGISTACLFPLETDDALLHLARAGIRDVEIFFNAQCETKNNLLRSFCAIQNEYGINVRAVHTYCAFVDATLLFRKYERRLKDGLDIYRKLADACRALSCDLLILHGDSEFHGIGNPQHLNNAEYVERFDLLCREIHREGVRLSQENVVGYRSGQIEQLRMLRDALGDNFYLTFDVKQAVRCEQNPLTMAKEFADHIVHVHLSDHGSAGDCLLPGRGTFSFPSLFTVLQEAGCRADYMIEVYRSAFQTEEELLESYRYTESLLTNVNKCAKNDCIFPETMLQ